MAEYPTSYITQLLNLLRVTGATAALVTANTLLCVPSSILAHRGVPKLLTLGCGLISCEAARRLAVARLKLGDTAADLELVDRRANIGWYKKFVTPTTEVQLPAYTLQDLQADMITDLPSYIWERQKHIALVGGTGDGKSTVIKYLISQWHGEVKVYDPDATVDDYRDVPKVQVVGIGDNTKAIFKQMEDDLELLKKRLQERSQQGRNWQATPYLIVAEETPALASESDIVGEWLSKLAKRGRKPQVFICVAAQNDTAKNFGLEGDYEVFNSCFTRVYLGSKAIARAKYLKNETLIRWLQGSRYGRVLVDDRPCEVYVNGSYTTPKTTLIDTPKTLEPLQELAELEIEEGTISDEKPSQELRNLVWRLHNDGYSKTKIAELLGGRRQDALRRVSELLDNK